MNCTVSSAICLISCNQGYMFFEMNKAWTQFKCENMWYTVFDKCTKLDLFSHIWHFDSFYVLTLKRQAAENETCICGFMCGFIIVESCNSESSLSELCREKAFRQAVSFVHDRDEFKR